MDDLTVSSAQLKEVEGKAFHSPFAGAFVADLFTKEECDAIRTEANGLKTWEQAKITTYERNDAGEIVLVSTLDRDKRECDRIHLDDLDLADHPVFQDCLSQIAQSAFPYIHSEFGLDVSEIAEGQIVRYPVGGQFIPHTDANKLKPYRAFTAILFLNDDFGGGGTSFPNANNRVGAKTGRVLLFPSAELHAGEVVLDGSKEIVVAWIFYPD